MSFTLASYVKTLWFTLKDRQFSFSLEAFSHTVTIAISPLPVENPSVAPFCSDDMGGWVSNSVLLGGWIFGGSVAMKSPVLAFPLSMTDVWVFISVASDSV